MATALFGDAIKQLEEHHGGDDDGDDDDDKEDRKRKIKKIIELILHYHILPGGGFSGKELADYATAATSLPYGSGEDADHFRVRIRPTLVPAPSLLINFYARTRVEVQAKNGASRMLG